jgi:nucleoside-diphosphate-sugar epimerase
MKVLISGATGFIGKNLILAMLEKDITVYAIIRKNTDIKHLPKKVKTFVFENDINELMNFIKKQKFNGVIHLASLFLAQHKPTDIEGLKSSTRMNTRPLFHEMLSGQTSFRHPEQLSD